MTQTFIVILFYLAFVASFALGMACSLPVVS